MTYNWQQPLRRLEFKYQREDSTWTDWAPVLFVRATSDGWEVMSINGVIHTRRNALLRFAP